MSLEQEALKFITITKVELTRDMRLAKVYFSGFKKEDNCDPQSLVSLMLKNRGAIRKELSLKLNLRHTPELKFYYDDSIEYAQKINDIINKIKEEE